MRFEGTLTSWNDDRGFGFITPTQGGQEVFVHIKAFQHLNGGRPQVGQCLTFELEFSPDGKKRGCRVQFAQPTRAARTVSVPHRPVPRPVIRLKTSILGLAVLVTVLSVGYDRIHGLINLPDRAPAVVQATVEAVSASAADNAIQSAFSAHRSNVQVVGQGTVIKVLPDDNDGSRHQRFILELSSGHTVLMAHNIDLAPRIGGLQTGDTVAFNGEYEWNSQGGVIHWTHRDPAGRHAAGWLRHGGQTYE